MKTKKSVDRIIVVPEGITIVCEGNLLKVKGDKGEVQRRFAYPGINLKLENKKLLVFSTSGNSRNIKRMVRTLESHIKNMIIGVSNGYAYRLKICSGHFPMKVTLESGTVVINNFLGEKIPRKAKILEGTTVEIDKDIIHIEGLDKEKVGQTMGNIERATRIVNRDRRVFQDGIYKIGETK